MIDFTEISKDGEIWELFARDFLQELGFFVESSPDRGPDGGKDIIVTEDLKGNLGNYKFRWLVSCKHFALSNKSVQEKDETNILERIKDHNADGFIGFYSTLSSSGLNTRLNSLKNRSEIKDYKIFDHKIIENYLVTIGFSKIIMRYLPENYKSVKPLHIISETYVPLECAYCKKDILEALYREDYIGNIIFVIIKNRSNHSSKYIEDIYCCCKGNCDKLLDESNYNKNIVTKHFTISNIAIPNLFLDFILTCLNTTRSDKYIYTNEAFDKLRDIIVAISQKVFREMTSEEQERASQLKKNRFRL